MLKNVIKGGEKIDGKCFVSEVGDYAVFQGHGFLTVYNGSELSYKISQLRRNTEYKFRVSSSLTILRQSCRSINVLNACINS